jgi:hypothetical protein
MKPCERMDLSWDSYLCASFSKARTACSCLSAVFGPVLNKKKALRVKEGGKE